MLGGQVLERREAFSHRAYLLDRERAAVSVERADRLAYAEVARGPRRGASERTSEKPVRGPATEAADGHEGLDDVGVRERSQALEVEIERKPKKKGDLRSGLDASRVEAHSAAHRLDPHLAAGDDALEPAVVPDRRPIRSVRAEAHGREREVIGLRDGQVHGGRTSYP